MGQAAVVLPESPEQAPAPVSGTDDLLSQLAGQEIDRLLAEADANPEEEKQNADGSSTTTQNDIEAMLNAVEKAEKLSLPPVPADPTPAAATAPSAPVTPVIVEAPVGVAAPAAPAKIETTPAPSKQEPVANADLQTSAAERAALTPPVELLPREQAEAAGLVSNRVPIYVRILELINAPFDACPDMLRDALGKIAILTLMNSIGVLLYLMLFRK